MVTPDYRLLIHSNNRDLNILKDTKVESREQIALSFEMPA